MSVEGLAVVAPRVEGVELRRVGWVEAQVFAAVDSVGLGRIR